MVVHLGMTGKLIAFDSPDPPPDYTKLLIAFEGDRRLAFRCPRKLGSVEIIDEPRRFISDKGLGPDALSIDREQFVDAIGRSRGAIKSALMSQQKLAGIGNLWSDETLYRIGVPPTAPGSSLSRNTLSQAYEAMTEILATVMNVEADYSKLPKDWLVRNRTKDKNCPRCNGTIVVEKVGGRSAYHCETHQAA